MFVDKMRYNGGTYHKRLRININYQTQNKGLFLQRTNQVQSLQEDHKKAQLMEEQIGQDILRTFITL